MNERKELQMLFLLGAGFQLIEVTDHYAVSGQLLASEIQALIDEIDDLVWLQTTPLI